MQTRTNSKTYLLRVLLVLSALWVSSSFAQEGVVDLSDYATITNPGSYRVTRDIALFGGNAIEVKASGVTLDLNGHIVSGGSFFISNDAGIFQHPGYRDLTVMNGTVIGADGVGVKAEGEGTRVINVRIRDSAGGALELGHEATVEDCIISSNDLSGASFLIEVDVGSQIKNTQIIGNSGSTLFGIYAQKDAVIEGVSVSRNTASTTFGGIQAGHGSLVRSCSVHSNVAGAVSLSGVEVGERSVITKTSVTYNRAASIITAFHGGKGTRISKCIAGQNSSSSATARGFWHEGDGIIEACVAQDNDATYGYGFFVETNVLVEACTARNGSGTGFSSRFGSTFRHCVAKGNGDDGFYLDDWNFIEYCLADNNAVYGVHVIGNNNRIENCSSHDSDWGFVITGTGNMITGCDAWNSSSDNYSIDAGNSYGTLNSTPGTDFTTDNPWTNFELN